MVGVSVSIFSERPLFFEVCISMVPKFKPSCSEKAKNALMEAIDVTTYEEAARMVAFKIPCDKLAI